MANVTESHPRADCGGAASMGQIGNDVSPFYKLLFSLVSLFCPREVCRPGRVPETNAPVAASPGSFFFLLFFFFFLFFPVSLFRLVTARREGSTGFSAFSA